MCAEQDKIQLTVILLEGYLKIWLFWIIIIFN